jgi:hypothetical protein
VKCRNTGKERDSYLLYVRKLDIEMSPDTLEVEGVNKLFVTVTVDESFIPEQTVSGSSSRIDPRERILRTYFFWEFFFLNS